MRPCQRPFARTPYSGINARRKAQWAAKGAPEHMTCIHAIAAGDLEWALYAVSLLVSVLRDELLLIMQRRDLADEALGLVGGADCSD